MTTTIEDRRAGGRALPRGHPACSAGRPGGARARRARSDRGAAGTSGPRGDDDLVPIRYRAHGRLAVRLPAGRSRDHGRRSRADADDGVGYKRAGDAHVRNFGKFATPERNLVFSINDFDETLPAPWEWDVKRLGASTDLVASEHEFNDAKCRDTVLTAFACLPRADVVVRVMRTLDLWYDHTSVDDVLGHFRKKVPRTRRARCAQGVAQGPSACDRSFTS